MYSIRKHLRIQVLLKGVSYTSPNYSSIQHSIKIQEIPDRVRLLIGKVSDQTKQTMEKDPDIASELDKYKISALKNFFLSYPHAWPDLKRKLHKYRKSEEMRYWIPKTNEGEVYSIFLRSDREEGIGELINTAIPKEILRNSALIEHASSSISLLDTSYLDIQAAEDTITDKEKFIKILIQKGLSENANIPRSQSEERFGEIFEKVYPYLGSIFHMDLESMGIGPDEDLESLVNRIVAIIWNADSASGNGLKAKNAWMIVKAFHAWGSIEKIIKAREEALEGVKRLPKILASIGITIKNPEQTQDAEGNISFAGDIEVALLNGDTRNAHIVYRVKSLESLLVKLWADEDYTNTDALRDLIGGAIHSDFGEDQEFKTEIVQKISNLYANRGYMYKDKGGLENGVLSKEFYKKIKYFGKKPLTQSSHRDAYSSNIVRNISLSGFMSYGNIPVGTEFQFFDTKDFHKWKEEHPEYHPRRILRAWARGQDFVTPGQTIATYYTHRKPRLEISKLKSLIRDQIGGEHIIPYFIEYNSSNQALFALGKSEKKFEERFPGAQKIESPLDDQDFISFIDALCESVSSSTLPTSQLPPSPDQ